QGGNNGSDDRELHLASAVFGMDLWCAERPLRNSGGNGSLWCSRVHVRSARTGDRHPSGAGCEYQERVSRDSTRRDDSAAIRYWSERGSCTAAVAASDGPAVW